MAGKQIGAGIGLIGKLGKMLGLGGGDDDAPAFAPAVFGKHPGWNDHMDELGLVTQRLVDFRRSFYTEGVGALIDEGRWEALDEDEREETFDHAFARRVGGSWLVGRFWSSVDGRGRTKYPMVVVVDCGGASLESALRVGIPACDEARDVFRGTERADDVRAHFESMQQNLVQHPPEAEGSEPLSHAQALRRLINHPLVADDEDAVMRALYGAERELGVVLGVVRGSSSSVTTTMSASSGEGHVRLPRSEPGVLMALRLWGSVLGPASSSRVVLTVFAPEHAGWVDAVTGIRSQELLCLRSSVGKTPLASDVPYTIEDEFRERVGRAAETPSA